ncbi:hypothetical protein THAOC_23761 [Thalassiosira oceanica]|uniref:Peptidase M6-like domain-containing protein n=1 Tax=Thalassiosira oceanica TaxID=159749 RepID=K0RTK5_THAOC|nr:hypothetical protein THAOC_23761 [Thalassiosira oceanica]|eukprot:EJK56365.1 hypothetical protein THAOC_23761 [Thalassiosira oceanica]
MQTMKIDMARTIPLLVLLTTLDPAGALLRGFDSAAAPPAEAVVGAARPLSHDCTIQVVSLLEIPGETPEDFEDLVFECELDPADEPGGRSNIYRKVEGNKSQMKELRDMLDSGDLVAGMSTLSLKPAALEMVASGGLADVDTDTTEQAELDGDVVKLPKGMNIRNRVEKLGNKNIHPSNYYARRRLQNGGLTGPKTMLAVKVIDPNGLERPETPAVIADKLFGTSGDSATLKSQLEACSYDQLNIIPGDNNAPEMNGKRGVYELANGGGGPNSGTMTVTIDVPLTGDVTRNQIHNDAKLKVEQALGFSLPGPFEQVLFVVEKCYTSPSNDCGYAAYAYINSWMSVYQDRYFAYPGVLVHELGKDLWHLLVLQRRLLTTLLPKNMSGHNFGMAHSGGLDGATYTDHTCMMGNPLYSDNTAKMCYNPAKNWYLGWYDNDNENDRTEVINPIGQPNTWSVTRTLVGIADWGDSQSDWGNPPATTDYPVIIKLETDSSNDFFLGFNRARGINADNDEGDNLVTVIETGSDGEGYSQSFLRAKKSQGGAHTLENFGGTGNDLEIVVDQINQGGSFWTATVTIGWVDCLTDNDCNPNPLCFQAETCNVISKTCEPGPPEPDCCGNGVCDGDETLFTCPVDKCPYGGCADDCRTVRYTGVSNYGNNAGIFFKVQAQNALVVSKLSVRPFTGGTCRFDVWTKTGDFEAYTESSDDWTKIDLDNGGNADCTSWSGSGAIQTDLPDFLSPVGIQAGQFQSFYVKAQTGDLIWRSEGSLGDVISSNDDISMFTGKWSSGEFSGVQSTVVKLTGTVTYGLAPTGPVSSPPTSLPTNPPTNQVCVLPDSCWLIFTSYKMMLTSNFTAN